MSHYELRMCICADPENCREEVPGYVCRRRSPAMSDKDAPPSAPQATGGTQEWARSPFDTGECCCNVHGEDGRLACPIHGLTASTPQATGGTKELAEALNRAVTLYHTTIEGEYGCPGESCPGVQRLRLFVASCAALALRYGLPAAREAPSDGSVSTVNDGETREQPSQPSSAVPTPPEAERPVLSHKMLPVDACEDCGVLYQDFPLDIVLPDADWLAIHPTGGGGLLCSGCIAKRVAALPTSIVVFAQIVLDKDHDAFRVLKNLNLNYLASLAADLARVTRERDQLKTELEKVSRVGGHSRLDREERSTGSTASTD